jgi:cell division topological specificity factor
MAGFFDRMLGRGNHKGSGATAKERLQVVLVHDRINLPPEKLQEMKREILAVISKYVEVDTAHTDIVLQQSGDRRTNMLVAEIAFTRSQEIDSDEFDYTDETLLHEPVKDTDSDHAHESDTIADAPQSSSDSGQSDTSSSSQSD